jgi:hypothetical protein
MATEQELKVPFWPGKLTRHRSLGFDVVLLKIIKAPENKAGALSFRAGHQGEALAMPIQRNGIHQSCYVRMKDRLPPSLEL